MLHSRRFFSPVASYFDCTTEVRKLPNLYDRVGLKRFGQQRELRGDDNLAGNP